MNVIAKPFGALMLFLYNLVGNYGLAIFLFALVVNLVLLPFQMKSKRSMMRMSRFTPKLKELEKKYANNQQKYQAEVAKLYKQEKVNPMSGCLWSLLPFPILIALYSAIRQPLTTMMGVEEALLQSGGAIYERLTSLGYTIGTGAYEQIHQSQFITAHFESFAGLSDRLIPLDYSFLGLNLGDVPSFQVWNFDWSSAAAWGPALGLFLIPLISAAFSYLSMVVSNKSNPQTEAAGAQMKTMMLMMPLISLWIGFSMPAALGLYWIFSSVLGAVKDFIMTKYYRRVLDKEDAERIAQEKEREAELERKRQETEKLRAEGKTTKNVNTSKRRLQAQEKAKEDERVAALERADRAARRARLGITEEEKPASQVGNRRYARGRAYVPDRFTNPEGAEEATRLAAAASEGDEAIDPDVPDDMPPVKSPASGETETENNAGEDIGDPEDAEASEQTGDTDNAGIEAKED